MRLMRTLNKEKEACKQNKTLIEWSELKARHFPYGARRIGQTAARSNAGEQTVMH